MSKRPTQGLLSDLRVAINADLTDSRSKEKFRLALNNVIESALNAEDEGVEVYTTTEKLRFAAEEAAKKFSQDDPVTSENAGIYTQKAAINVVDLAIGDYLVAWYAEFEGTGEVTYKVEENGNLLGEGTLVLSVGKWQPVFGIAKFETLAVANNDIVLSFKQDTPPDQVNARRGRIRLELL